MTDTIDADSVTAAESLLPPVQEGQDVAVREAGAPSGYKIEQAMSAWQAARARLLEGDADLARDEAALTELLGEEEADVRTILTRLLRGAVHAEAMASAASDQMEVLKGRHARYKARGQTMRQVAFNIMDVMGEKKVELPDLTASVRKGQQSAMIVDEAAVPDIYVEIVETRKPDRATILSVLKSGGDVPGTFLSNGLPTLSIRTK